MADAVTTRLVTSPMLSEDPPCFRVSWIVWDSGFRGTGLALKTINAERDSAIKVLEDSSVMANASKISSDLERRALVEALRR